MRIRIDSIVAGSLIITFTILPPFDGSGILASQAAALLELLILDEESPLYTDEGSITSQEIERSLEPLIVVSSTVSDTDKTIAKKAQETIGPKLSVNVVDFQGGGLFSFRDTEIAATEHDNHVGIIVDREHGANKTVTLRISTNDTSATRGSDYDLIDDGTLINRENGAYYIRFSDGVRSKTINFEIKNDDIVENHFEEFVVSLQIDGQVDPAFPQLLARMVMHAYVYLTWEMGEYCGSQNLWLQGCHRFYKRLEDRGKWGVWPYVVG